MLNGYYILLRVVFRPTCSFSMGWNSDGSCGLKQFTFNFALTGFWMLSNDVISGTMAIRIGIIVLLLLDINWACDARKLANSSGKSHTHSLDASLHFLWGF